MNSHDNILELLVDHSIPDFYDSLQILLTSRDWIPRFFDENGQERIVIIEGVNKLSTEDKETINLASQRWNEITSSVFEKEIDQSKLVESVKKFLENLKNPHKIPVSLLSKEIIEGITADLIQQCISKYQVQSKLFDDEKVIRQLSSKSLPLLEPWAQTGVCGFCKNLELLLATYPRTQTQCPTCNRQMSIVRVYKLNKEFEKLKLENQDLPEFIKSFIQRKVQDAKIETLHQLDGGKNGDIDVHLPSLGMGIECKLFINPNPEGKYFKSCIAELANSLKKYVKFGKIKNLLAVINLNESYEADVKKEIQRILNEEHLVYDDLRVVCFSFKKLIEILESEILHLKSISESKN